MLILSVFSFCVTTTISAETVNKDAAEKAVQIAQKIKDEQLLLPIKNSQTVSASSNQNPEQRLEQLRDKFISQVWSAKKNDITEVVKSYTDVAQEHGTKTDKDIGKLLEAFLVQYDDKFSETVFLNARNALEPFYLSPDWFVRHQAYNLASLSYPGDTNLSVSLETAQDGLKQVPQGSGPYTFEAKSASVSSLSYLHSVLLNLELSVDSYAKQIELKTSRGKPIDGMSIINNLIYVFKAWKDNETAKKLVDILLSLEESHPSSGAGLTELHASRIHAALGDFETALKYSETTVSVCDVDTICNMGRFARVISLAGLERTEEVKQALVNLQTEFNSQDWRSLTSTQNAYQIQALLAAAEGDTSSALQFMNRRMDASIQKTLSQNNSQTANLLASLQNSKERREERAAALETEAELKQIALKRQQYVNRLLVALSVILLSLVIAATAFARYRSRIATRMEIAAQKAVAGEKSKAEFLAIMSHELRTPLNGILGMADIMARKTTHPDIQEKMSVIANCGEDLLGLVENIFDMTLIESGDIHLYPERTNIHGILSALTQKWGPLIEEKNINFTAHIGADVPEYMDVDKERLTKSIDALLSNAHKFTKEGRVHLHVTALCDEGSSKTELKIIVADTGVGISEEAQSRLFKPFVQADSSMTRHFGGAGLGLAIARGLSQMMDGDIAVNSRSQRGSEFTLTIKAPKLETPSKTNDFAVTEMPRVKSISEQTHTAPQDGLSLEGVRILITEDDLDCQKVLKDVLKPTGAKLIFTINGAEGLEALSLNPYDLIITDIRMPIMDGFTFVERIRESSETYNNIPIIALTADTAAQTSARCKDAGVDIFLMKPVKSSALYEAIAHVQKKHRQDSLFISAVAS